MVKSVGVSVLTNYDKVQLQSSIRHDNFISRTGNVS